MAVDDELERGRKAYASRAWADAYEALARVDLADPLGPGDLELLARAAYMIGRDEDYVSGLERAHHGYLAAKDAPSAARCAFWIGHNLIFRGETSPALGWFGRAERLLEREVRDCPERGYVLVAALLQHIMSGDPVSAYATASEIADIGERFADPDLVALGLMEQGHALVRQGETAEGVRLIDETMVAVTTGELSPLVSGIVYCNTIAFCRDAYELRRAREWTAALTRWCDHQPEMVAHKGLCLVHRAEIMQLGGAWHEALDEVARVAEQFTDGVLNQRALGHAAYRRGELRRVRGEFDAAEAAYREAARLGREPQPGLALMWLSVGNTAAAAAAIRRALSETIRPLERVALLPAYVEIMLHLENIEEARSAYRELEAIAQRQRSEAIAAMSAHARGSVELADGDPGAALLALRHAWQTWDELHAPYEVARTRELLGLACAGVGDEESAALEHEAALAAFRDLGATDDVRRLEARTVEASRTSSYGLTARELEVLRLVAAGRTNREIAAALVISEHTARRHLQNIFRKLDVSSRAAATAHALQHQLV
jgi:DNA-binding CsgD family transcriptional regulator